METSITNKDENAIVMKEVNGLFIDSLKRNNKQIRDDRALAIAEDTEMLYKREIEDLGVSLKRLKRERETMLDLSPTDKQSLMMGLGFDPKDFVEQDIQIGIKIRNIEIKMDIAIKRYNYLFNGGD
jgi:hypothetical protein